MSEEIERRDSQERLLLERLGEHGLLQTAGIAVRVRDGVAYISGSVPNCSKKRLAAGIAREVEGVSDVVNTLRIAPMIVVDDDSLGRHLRQAFNRSRRIDGATVSVSVAHGLVRLVGFVATAAERCTVEDEVWATPGVRALSNELEVVCAAPRTDIQIVSDLLDALSKCLCLDLSAVEVRCRDCAVHLGGQVVSEDMRSAVEEAARWTPSVTHVANDLRVVHPARAGVVVVQQGA